MNLILTEMNIKYLLPKTEISKYHRYFLKHEGRFDLGSENCFARQGPQNLENENLNNGRFTCLILIRYFYVRTKIV